MPIRDSEFIGGPYDGEHPLTSMGKRIDNRGRIAVAAGKEIIGHYALTTVKDGTAVWKWERTEEGET